MNLPDFDPNRIFWRDFVPTKTYTALQVLLWLAGYRLVVMMDGHKVATDVFIRKIR